MVKTNSEGNVAYNIVDSSCVDEVLRKLNEGEIIKRSPEQLASRMIRIREMMDDCLRSRPHFSGYLCDLNNLDVNENSIKAVCEGMGELLDDLRWFCSTVTTLKDEYEACRQQLDG